MNICQTCGENKNKTIGLRKYCGDMIPINPKISKENLYICIDCFWKIFTKYLQKIALEERKR